jgi:predicted SprT family Zn-dependent metalloprotease
MNLDHAEIRAIDALREHGLIERGWSFKFDQAPRRFGYCNWRTKTIQLSSRLTKLNDEHHVYETILHEVAHALDAENRGHSNHDGQCVRIAQSIGCTGRRCYGAEVNTPPRRAVINLDDF